MHTRHPRRQLRVLIRARLPQRSNHTIHDLSRWESFDKSERVANHTPFGVIELMPISDPDLYAFKYVNGHPFNPARGFQTVTAFGVLADVHNGYPVFLAEMTVLTTLLGNFIILLFVSLMLDGP